MGSGRLTWRTVDGERVLGTWRHVWVRNGPRFILLDAVIYADGVVDGDRLSAVADFEARVRAGEVLTGPPDGTRNPSVEDFVRDVRDDVEHLNGRPGSEARCMDAAEAYALDPSEENRAALLAAFDEVPRRDALYAFTNEGPYNRDNIHILVAGVGNEYLTRTPRETGTALVTEEEHAEAVRSLLANRASARAEKRPAPEGGAEVVAPSVVIPDSFEIDGVRYGATSEKAPRIMGLRNGYPALIEVGGRECSIDKAFWALSVADRELRASLLGMKDIDAIDTAVSAARREDWSQMRTAVMAELLRAKFARYPELAEVLRDTGDARLLYDGVDRFWHHSARGGGRNWMGRLLEQVRAELVAGDGVLEV